MTTLSIHLAGLLWGMNGCVALNTTPDLQLGLSACWLLLFIVADDTIDCSIKYNK